MAKMTVYVTDDLRGRMAGVEDVVWSQVASEAFEQKLGAIAEQKKEKVLEDVIDRLRASKLAHESEEKAAGREAGREWAKNKAAAAELERLQKAIASNAGNDLDLFIIPAGNSLCGAELFYQEIRSPQEKWDDERWNSEDESTRSLWDLVDGDKYPSDEYVQAFAEGALEIWDEVQDKL